MTEKLQDRLRQFAGRIYWEPAAAKTEKSEKWWRELRKMCYRAADAIDERDRLRQALRKLVEAAEKGADVGKTWEATKLGEWQIEIRASLDAAKGLLERCDCCGEREVSEVCKDCRYVYCEICVEPREHGCTGRGISDGGLAT